MNLFPCGRNGTMWCFMIVGDAGRAAEVIPWRYLPIQAEFRSRKITGILAFAIQRRCGWINGSFEDQQVFVPWYQYERRSRDVTGPQSSTSTRKVIQFW